MCNNLSPDRCAGMRAEGRNARRVRRRSNKRVAICCGRNNVSLRFDTPLARAHPSAASGVESARHATLLSGRGSGLSG